MKKLKKLVTVLLSIAMITVMVPASSFALTKEVIPDSEYLELQDDNIYISGTVAFPEQDRTIITYKHEIPEGKAIKWNLKGERYYSTYFDERSIAIYIQYNETIKVNYEIVDSKTELTEIKNGVREKSESFPDLLSAYQATYRFSNADIELKLLADDNFIFGLSYGDPNPDKIIINLNGHSINGGINSCSKVADKELIVKGPGTLNTSLNNESLTLENLKNLTIEDDVILKGPVSLNGVKSTKINGVKFEKNNTEASADFKGDASSLENLKIYKGFFSVPFKENPSTSENHIKWLAEGAKVEGGCFTLSGEWVPSEMPCLYRVYTMEALQDVTLSSAFTKINDNVYKFRTNGSQIRAIPIVKNKDGKKLTVCKDYTETYSSDERINPGKYTITVTGIGDYKGSVTKTLIITPEPVTNVKVRMCKYAGGYDDAYITWNKSPFADGYQVYYRRPSVTKNWTSIGTTTKTSFIKKNMYDGYKYEFKVVPYVKSGKDLYRTTLDYKVVSMNTLKKLNTPFVGKYNNSKVRVKWNNIYAESGYQISRSTKKTGTYIVNTYPTTTGNYRLLNTKKNTGYYYKVRAYKVIDGTKVFAPWSNVKYFKLR